MLTTIRFLRYIIQTFFFSPCDCFVLLYPNVMCELTPPVLYFFWQAERSNMRHRPIGLGVQGLADLFILLRMPFDSPQAAELNKQVFETIYFGALTGIACFELYSFLGFVPT